MMGVGHVSVPLILDPVAWNIHDIHPQLIRCDPARWFWPNAECVLAIAWRILHQHLGLQLFEVWPAMSHDSPEVTPGHQEIG